MPGSTRKPRVDARVFLVLCLSVTVGIVLGLGGDEGELSVVAIRQGSGNIFGTGLAGGLQAAEQRWQRDYPSTASLSRDGFDREVVLDATPTPVPPQERSPITAAEDNKSGPSEEGGILLYGAASSGQGGNRPGDGDADLAPVVSYTALGEIVAAYPWPINEAFAVVDCESSWNPGAVSWNGTSYGLWQIWQGHAWRWPDFWSEWDNPEVNTQWAFELYLEQGWGIWDCW